MTGDMTQGTEIYVHIPFCVRKCAYCDFLSFPAEKDLQRQYVEALLREIRDEMPLEYAAGMPAGDTEIIRTAVRSAAGSPSADAETARTAAGSGRKEVSSVFLGGGTPSLLPAGWIAEILDALRSRFLFSGEAEITIEANPGTADAEKFRIWRQAGINRISFGCQSFHDQELRALGRIHTAEDSYRSIRTARQAGFTGINLDLISGIPGQSLESWEDNLRQAVSLSPEHISAYSLIIEENTPLYEIYGQNGPGLPDPEKENGLPPLPDEDTERLMYARTGQILAEAGYRQYEISNYAREGFACRHNIGYWTGLPYIGYGLGAAGYLPLKKGACFIRSTEEAGKKEGEIPQTGEKEFWVRYSHTRDLRTYLAGKDIYTDLQYLDRKDREAEFMILGLRMTAGVEDAEFEHRFGRSPDTVYGEILSRYESMGFLIREKGRTRLSPAGISVSNPILADFL